MNAAPLTLASERIALVPLAPAHLEALCALGLAPELWRATTIRVETRADMAAYLQRALEAQAAGAAVPFAIVERRTGAVVGTTRFHDLTPEHRSLEIGFTFIAPAWQRTFVNTEAKLLLLRHAFEAWQCLRVQFTANAINHASRAALRRLGAVEEAVWRHHRLSPHHGPCDLVVYSIVAAEWPAVRARLEERLRRGEGPLSPGATSGTQAQKS
jgi:RimJ/RimL family protein N-acetyltransferase